MHIQTLEKHIHNYMHNINQAQRERCEAKKRELKGTGVCRRPESNQKLIIRVWSTDLTFATLSAVAVTGHKAFARQ